MYKKYFKRPLDIVLSLVAIIIFSPIYLIVAVLVRVKLGSPVIFKQKRPGLHEKVFTMYKFRTMLDMRDKNGELLSDSIRLLKFGKWLRSTSLDELPELFNILKGDMSLVGPRPLAVQYLPYYTPKERKRHLVRPGLTGYAQIRGRNMLSWEERFNYDIFYIEHISLKTDLIIILNTFKKVFASDGIVIRGTKGVEDFDVYRKKSEHVIKR